MNELSEIFNNLVSFFSSTLEEAARLYPDKRLPEKPVIVLHASLSSFGHVPGGASMVVRALLRASRAYRATIVVPSHSDDRPTIIPKRNRCPGMGAIANYIDGSLLTRRSAHPFLSYSARGPRAGHLMKNHRPEHGLDFRSPSGRLFETDALIYMLGTGWDRCTLMHLAEYAFNRMQKEQGRETDTVSCYARTWRGPLIWEDAAFYPDLFNRLGDAFVRSYPNDIRIMYPPRIQEPFGRHTKPMPEEYRKRLHIVRAAKLIPFCIDRYPLLR